MGTKTYRRIEIGQFEVPMEAVALAEDITRLDLAYRILGEVDPMNCSEDINVGVDSHKMMRSMARLCAMAARHKLKRFLK